MGRASLVTAVFPRKTRCTYVGDCCFLVIWSESDHDIADARDVMARCRLTKPEQEKLVDQTSRSRLTSPKSWKRSARGPCAEGKQGDVIGLRSLRFERCYMCW